MNTFLYIVIIIAWIAIGTSSKKKKKAESVKKPPQYEPIHTELEPERPKTVRNSEKNRRINKPKALPKDPAPVKTDIAEGVIQQRKEDVVNMQNEVAMMEKVRDLIVCGYPVDIPGQRDFVKEGEDFLANLGTNNTFF